MNPLPGTPTWAQNIPAQGGFRPVPQEWKKPIADVYKKYPKLPKGYMEALLMQESSMGTNPTNYNSQIGESAWLGGLTSVARQDLARKGIQSDFNTQAGAIQAAGDYSAMRQSGVDDKGTPFEYKDPLELYENRYKTRSKRSLPLRPSARQQFIDSVAFYSK